jgi:hypothetical protein
MTENQMRVFRRKVLQLIDEIGDVSDTMEWYFPSPSLNIVSFFSLSAE